MPNYRRVRIKGGTYFITLVTNQRNEVFSSQNARDLFMKAVDHVRIHHPFHLIAYCILPDHIHLIMKLPDEDDNFSLRIGEIKKYFNKLHKSKSNNQYKPISTSRENQSLWQNRFWEHHIRDQDDLYKHFDYIHYNPVKHNLISYSKDWPSSSFLDFVKQGYYEIDWGQGPSIENEKYLFGE